MARSPAIRQASTVTAVTDRAGSDATHDREWGGESDPLGSRLVRYAIDEAAGSATRTWEWRHPDALFTFVFGDVDALTDGGHLSSWGNYAQVLRTDAAGAVVWRAQVEPGFMGAQVERFEGF